MLAHACYFRCMANTSTRKPAQRRRPPTPAMLKRKYRTDFFLHLRASVVLLLLVVGAFASRGLFSGLAWFVLLIFVANAVLGGIALVAWRRFW